jgi:hypothetical protein
MFVLRCWVFYVEKSLIIVWFTIIRISDAHEKEIKLFWSLMIHSLKKFDHVKYHWGNLLWWFLNSSNIVLLHMANLVARILYCIIKEILCLVSFCYKNIQTMVVSPRAKILATMKVARQENSCKNKWKFKKITLITIVRNSKEAIWSWWSKCQTPMQI